MNEGRPHRRLDGNSVAPGVAIGRAFIYRKEVPPISQRRIAADQVEIEVERFLTSLHQAGEEIRRTQHLVEQEQGADLAQIFAAQLTMLEDPEIREQTLKWIRQKSYSAERAFSVTLQQMKKIFASIENDYLRARMSDVMDIENQVLIRLTGTDYGVLDRAPRGNCIVVMRELMPSETALLQRQRVKGIVTDVGGAASHASIIARALRLPTVSGTEEASQIIQSGDLVIVDGSAGEVHLHPDPDVMRRFSNRLRRQVRRERSLNDRRGLVPITTDGHEIVLQANIDLPLELQMAVNNGARGVGMYRTEFLYNSYQLPSEEEQLHNYIQVVESVAPYPAVIRTLDLGGDKLSHVIDAVPEANPFLGWRGIRICLDTPVVFRTQLRALLRAGSRGEVSILFPMIASLDEWRRARGMVDEVRNELVMAGLPCASDCKVGVMVEVPSVALMAREFAPEVDFFSLGTNDLTQYTLAVDRGANRVAELYDPFHPAVLRLIRMVADTGSEFGVPVGICGEMAGDPLATSLLVGLGLKTFSLSPGMIPEIKEEVRSISLSEAKLLSSACLDASTAMEVRRFLEQSVGARLAALPFGSVRRRVGESDLPDA